MSKLFKILIAGIFLFTTPALAEDINYDSMKQGGFEDVAKLLESMTPEQRAEVMRQATLRAQELEKMSPKEREALKRDLRVTADTLDLQKIDPKKLDPAKSKPTHEIQKDLNTYQNKYKQGKINNAVAKPLPPQTNTTPNR
jgi:hypothetical protein